MSPPARRLAPALLSLIALFPLLTAARGVTVSGLVDHPDAGGALLLAERGDRAVSTSIVDLDGGFVLYDVPPGAVSLVGLLAGLHLPPTAVDVPEAGLAGWSWAPSRPTAWCRGRSASSTRPAAPRPR